MAAAKKKSKCPSTVPALTKALGKAVQKEKIATAKKKAEAKVLAMIQKKKAASSKRKLDSAAKKLKAIWQ